nr:hypothetical protein [Angustibacter aerolatus]
MRRRSRGPLRWATTSRTCATWSSTSSRCSVARSLLGSGPYDEVDADTAREMLREVARLAEHELAESLLDSDRNPPVFDPATHTVQPARGLQVVVPRLPRRRVVAHRHPGRDGRHRRAAVAALGDGRAWCWARTPACTCTRPASRSRRCSTSLGTDPQKQPGAAPGRPPLGRHDGAHRAGRRVGRRRRPHEGGAAARRHLARHRRQAVHHQRRGRRLRQRRALRPRPPRGRRAGHQGPEPVHRAEVPRRPRDRRAWASATARSSRTSSTRWA